MPTNYVALLRGVNVGGKNKLPMKELVEIVERVGCTEVQNYIQSGNVIFRSTASIAKKVPELVAAEIERRFGFQTRLVVRTTEQLREVANTNPFLAKGAPVELLSVMFLATTPEPSDVARLDPNRSPGDEFEVRGDTIFLHTPTGLAETKLTNAYFDSRLRTVGTSRNWRTTLKLLELMGG